MSSLNVNLLRHTGRPIFRRNPRIFPPAKSKLLREKEPHIQDPTEAELLATWWKDYHLRMASIRDLLALSYKHQNVSTVDTVETEEAFDPELAVVNDEWNQKTKVQRENYYLQFFSGKIMDSLTRREDYDRLEVDRIEKLRAKLLSVMNTSSAMVTSENLESRLDEIMSSEPIDYNYAVSKRGQPVPLGQEEVDAEPTQS